MEEKKYLNMLLNFQNAYKENYYLIIQWKNGLKILCKSHTGIYETDTEPEDDDYIGEYAAAVSILKILQHGNDDSVGIFYNTIEICIFSIPQKIMLEDGTVLWENDED